MAPTMMQSNQIEAMLEEQEEIYKQKRDKTEELSDRPHSKQGDSSPGLHKEGREAERSDDARRKRREHDRYDGRRANDRHVSDREDPDHRRARRSREGDVLDARPGSRGSVNGSTRGRNRSHSPQPNNRRSDGRGYRTRSRSRTLSPSRHSRSGSHVTRPSRGSDDYRRDDRRLERYDDHRHSGRREDSRRNGRRGDGHRGPRRSPETRPRSPDPTDEERDGRTIFVQQLAARLKNKELRKFFEPIGKVVDAQIVVDRVSGRSKGVGYVEFKEEASVQSAMALTGQKLLGIPIIVSLTEAEKNRQARMRESNVTRNNSVPQTRLYVGNIQFSLTEQDLISVFGPWGPLANVFLQKDENGRSRGYAFVEYVQPDDAKRALESMNNFLVGDRAIRVGLGGDRNSQFPEAEKTANVNPRGANPQGSSFSGMGGRGTHAGGSGSFDRPGGRDADKIGGASALDDVDMESVNFNSYSRDALMRKLARTDEPTQTVAPRAEAHNVSFDMPTATRCILLKNVYDHKDMQLPNWQAEFRDDIRLECEQKYGKVVHIAMAPENNDGEVYIKFENVSGGAKAYQSLQGRLFGGHRITAQYVVDVIYNSLYPKAASV